MTIQGEKICPEETAQEKLGFAQRAALHAYIVPTPLPFLHGSSQEARGPFWVPTPRGERAGPVGTRAPVWIKCGVCT